MRRLPGVAGILVLLALWQAGHMVYGPLVLPGLGETAATLWRLAREGAIVPALLATALHALAGWLIGALAGTLAGAAAGLRPAVGAALQPVVIVLLGVPAIAWIVLALLWFGGDRAVIFTVAVATGPLVFAAAREGAGSLDGGLARMARAFRAPPRAMVLDVYLPHMIGHLFPALTTAFALSWKVAIMAELLSGAAGIGDGIAGARARVDTAETMAWIALIVAVLILLDTVLLGRLRRHVARWREGDGSLAP